MNRRLWVLFSMFGAGIVVLVQSIAGAQTTSYEVVPRPFKIQPISTKGVPRPLDKALGRASGLAWQLPNDGNRGKLWIAFEGARKLVRLDPADTKTIVFAKPGTVQFVPGLLAFDYKTAPGSNLDDTATRLWSINENRSAINRGIVTDVTGPNTGGVPGFAPTEGREISDIYHRSKITGFALDPIRDTSQTEYYVACRAGGLCSTIEVIRRDNSHTIARIYPGCEPIGIAIDPLGRSLWILANRGPDSTPVLLERRLDASTPVARLRSASGPTKTIRELNIRGRPVAIAATENSVWVLSNVMVLENGEPSEHAFVSEFVIGSGP